MIYRQSVCPATGPAAIGYLIEMEIPQAKPSARAASDMIYTLERWHGLLSADSITVRRSVGVEKRGPLSYC